MKHELLRIIFVILCLNSINRMIQNGLVFSAICANQSLRYSTYVVFVQLQLAQSFTLILFVYSTYRNSYIYKSLLQS